MWGCSVNLVATRLWYLIGRLGLVTGGEVVPSGVLKLSEPMGGNGGVKEAPLNEDKAGNEA